MRAGHSRVQSSSSSGCFCGDIWTAHLSWSVVWMLWVIQNHKLMCILFLQGCFCFFLRLPGRTVDQNVMRYTVVFVTCVFHVSDWTCIRGFVFIQTLVQKDRDCNLPVRLGVVGNSGVKCLVRRHNNTQTAQLWNWTTNISLLQLPQVNWSGKLKVQRKVRSVDVM